MDAITLLPGRAALLVVDVQERLLPAMHAPDARRLLACLDALVESAQRFKLPVYVTEQYPSGLGPTVPEVRAMLERLERAPVVAEKTVFSAAAVPEVARGLADDGVASVIVTGVEAHVCVFQTARALAAQGLDVHVPFDAVASRDPEAKSRALALLSQKGVAVTTTETAVFDLLGDAKNVHFRPLSKLVRPIVG